MTNILAIDTTRSGYRPEGWASIASGLIGGLALICLIWYIATPENQIQNSGLVAPLGRLLLETNFVAAMIQSLLMVPVAVCLARLSLQLFQAWKLAEASVPRNPANVFSNCLEPNSLELSPFLQSGAT